MNKLLNETQKEIIAMSAKFAAKELLPIVDGDEQKSFFRKELFPKLGAAGLLGITTDVNFGGAGLGTFEYTLALEELASVSGGYAVSTSVTNLASGIIEKFGNQKQKEKYVPNLVEGKTIGAFALTEPGSGSDAASLKTKAEKQNDYFLINGIKQFITNGEYADTYIVLARTSPDRTRGVSAFIVEKSFAGVSGGKIEKKMGMRVSPTQEMIFENVKVPVENLIGELGGGFKIALSALDTGRISIASIANGISRAAFEKACAYAKEREQFGKAIFEFQGVSFMLANMATELAASRALVRATANLKDAGHPFSLESAMCKLKATEACMQITTDAVQVFGGYGYMEEFTVERYMREAKMLQLVEGTSQIQKRVIANNL